MISSKPSVKIKSNTPRYAATATDAKMTMSVKKTVCLRVGQLTWVSSFLVSFIYSMMLIFLFYY